MMALATKRRLSSNSLRFALGNLIYVLGCIISGRYFRWTGIDVASAILTMLLLNIFGLLSLRNNPQGQEMNKQ
jgi:hypothetical protein